MGHPTDFIFVFVIIHDCPYTSLCWEEETTTLPFTSSVKPFVKKFPFSILRVYLVVKVRIHIEFSLF